MDKQKVPTVLHMDLCLMLHGSLNGRGVWEKMDTCVCTAESLCCPAETITLLVCTTQFVNWPYSNIKYKVKNNHLNIIGIS